MTDIITAREARSFADFVHSMDAEIKALNYSIRTAYEQGAYSTDIDFSKFENSRINPLITLLRGAGYGVIYNKITGIANVDWGTEG